MSFKTKKNAPDQPVSVTATFDTPDEAQYARTALLISGYKPEDMGLTPENWETEQHNTTLVIQGMKNEATVASALRREEQVRESLAKFAKEKLKVGSQYIPIEIECPHIRCNSADKFKIVFPCPGWEFSETRTTHMEAASILIHKLNNDSIPLENRIDAEMKPLRVQQTSESPKVQCGLEMTVPEGTAPNLGSSLKVIFPPEISQVQVASEAASKPTMKKK